VSFLYVVVVYVIYLGFVIT